MRVDAPPRDADRRPQRSGWPDATRRVLAPRDDRIAPSGPAVESTEEGHDRSATDDRGGHRGDPGMGRRGPSRTSRIAAGLTNVNHRVVVDGRPLLRPHPRGRRPSCWRWIGPTSATTRSRRPRPASRRGSSPSSKRGTSSRSSGSTAGRCRTRRFGAPGMPTRIAGDAPAAPRRAALPRRLRHVPPDASATSPSSTSATSRSRPGYRERLPAIPRIEAALAAHPLPTVPCHNDLLAENYLDDGERLWIVDYEYSGNNDPTFELGNTCQELGYDDAPGARAVRGLLRRGLPRPARPDAAPDDHVRRRLDAVGRHPGAHLADRLRLLGLGGGALGARAARARRARLRGLAARRAT